MPFWSFYVVLYAPRALYESCSFVSSFRIYFTANGIFGTQSDSFMAYPLVHTKHKNMRRIHENTIHGQRRNCIPKVHQHNASYTSRHHGPGAGAADLSDEISLTRQRASAHAPRIFHIEYRGHGVMAKKNHLLTLCYHAIPFGIHHVQLDASSIKPPYGQRAVLGFHRVPRDETRELEPCIGLHRTNSWASQGIPSGG